MKLLRRNTTKFVYYPNVGETSDVVNGIHTGEFKPIYGNPVYYRGNISAPVGNATDNLFGINLHYTHVLLMDDVKADIKEDGLIEWKNDMYEIKAVSPTINVLAIALKKQTKNHAEGGG